MLCSEITLSRLFQIVPEYQVTLENVIQVNDSTRNRASENLHISSNGLQRFTQTFVNGLGTKQLEPLSQV